MVIKFLTIKMKEILLSPKAKVDAISRTRSITNIYHQKTSETWKPKCTTASRYEKLKMSTHK